MTDLQTLNMMASLCEFRHEMEGEYCISLSFHDEEAYGSTIRRHPAKHQIVEMASRLSRLRCLNLRKSRLGRVPEMQSRSLEQIDLSCNDLESVPGWVLHQNSLKHLNLGSNNIANVPDLDHLPLDSLKLHKNIKMERMPKVGPKMKLLNLFLLFKMPEIPLEVFELKELEAFTFGVTKARQLGSLATLSNLKWLTLTVNEFDHLPDDICSLKKLQGLRLAKNKIKKLPSSFGNLNIDVLTLYNNELTDLPDSFFNLKLKKLNLARNPLKDKQRVADTFGGIEFFRM